MDEQRMLRRRQIRERVLGAAHAARGAENRTAFNANVQDFLPRFAERPTPAT